mmetsp:Transcript_10265/g.28292  ORF Transcript_10265/g.28292 Transcript_10265/m.28292 type:complete len:164 (+) Transcript_10265:52-543(+)
MAVLHCQDRSLQLWLYCIEIVCFGVSFLTDLLLWCGTSCSSLILVSIECLKMMSVHSLRTMEALCLDSINHADPFVYYFCSLVGDLHHPTAIIQPKPDSVLSNHMPLILKLQKPSSNPTANRKMDDSSADDNMDSVPNVVGDHFELLASTGGKKKQHLDVYNC